MSATVLVTGGSGFLGLHTILQLLERGYRVRATVRSLTREPEVRATIAAAGVDASDRLSFVAADLLSDDGWAAAVDGAEFVLHVASPFPASAPDHEDDLIIPAREGTLRVLRAARDAGVRRVVVTSSFAAVGYGVEPGDHVFTEVDWTDASADIGAYIKSKAIAERAAWDFDRGARMTRRRQPGRHLRPGPRRRPLRLDRDGLRPALGSDGGRDAAPVVLRRRRPRRGRPAPARDDRPGRRRRALHRRGR